MLQMEARCPRDLGAETTIAPWGTWTPDWPAQPAIKPQASYTKLPMSTVTQEPDGWVEENMNKEMNQEIKKKITRNKPYS